MPESDVALLTGSRRPNEGVLTVARGQVNKPPDAADDPLTVILVNFDTAHEFEIPAVNWAAGGRLPAQGDHCLVVFDDEGDAWIPAGAWTFTADGAGGYRVEVRSQRPATAAKVGDTFFASDQVAEYVWTGAAWTRTSTPAGVEADFAGPLANVPPGWEMLYGQNVERGGKYEDLFAALGTTHGAGNGSTTFGLPDSRGRVTVGRDNMGGSAAGRLAAANSETATGGAAAVTLTSGQSGVPAHTHPPGGETSGTPSFAVVRAGGAFATGTGATTYDRIQLTGANNAANASQSHENTQPWRTANRIVKL